MLVKTVNTSEAPEMETDSGEPIGLPPHLIACKSARSKPLSEPRLPERPGDDPKYCFGATDYQLKTEAELHQQK